MTLRGEIRARLIEAALDGPLPQAAGTGPEDALQAVLAVMERTVLPRRLSLRNGKGIEVTAHVANGRLLSLSGPAPDDASAALRTLFTGEPLGPETAGDVGAALYAFLADGGLAVMRAQPRDSGSDGVRPGLRPSDILGAVGAAATAETQPTCDLTDDERVRARIHIDDTGVDLGTQQDPDAHLLEEWAANNLEHLLSDAFPLASSLETQGTLLLDYGTTGQVRVTGHRGHLDLALLGPRGGSRT
jgi:hypothetical protein